MTHGNASAGDNSTELGLFQNSTELGFTRRGWTRCLAQRAGRIEREPLTAPGACSMALRQVPAASSAVSSDTTKRFQAAIYF